MNRLIKNLKIFKTSINYVMPIVLTTGISVSLVKIFGGGLPFIKDKEVKYKLYNITGSNYSNLEVIESYKTMNTLISTTSNSNICIYSPWVYNNNQYNRTITNYNFDSLSDKKLYENIINNNIDYLIDNYEVFTIEEEHANRINYKYDTSIVDYDVYIMDREDTLIEDESDVRNYTIAFLELGISSLIGIIVINNRKLSLIDSIKDINDEYKSLKLSKGGSNND